MIMGHEVDSLDEVFTVDRPDRVEKVIKVSPIVILPEELEEALLHGSRVEDQKVVHHLLDLIVS